MRKMYRLALETKKLISDKQSSVYEKEGVHVTKGHAVGLAVTEFCNFVDELPDDSRVKYGFLFDYVPYENSDFDNFEVDDSITTHLTLTNTALGQLEALQSELRKWLGINVTIPWVMKIVLRGSRCLDAGIDIPTEPK